MPASIRRCLMTSTLVVVALACAACQSTQKVDASTANAVNRVCPVMEHPVDNTSPTVVYKGQVVSFCCADCIPEWEKLPKSEKDKALAAVLKTP